MPSTKENIVEQSKALFNNKGYYQVTMRDIAKSAQTTLGNLTYHFPHKEDLVLEILKSAHNNLLHVLEERLHQGEMHPYSLVEVFETFVTTEQNEKEYSYYFNNLMELGRDYPSIREGQQYNRSIFLQYYHTAFLFLQRGQVLRADIPPAQYHSLARTIVLLMTIWNQHSSPTFDNAFENHSYFSTCADLIYSFLTEKGRQEYQAYFAYGSFPF